MPTPLESGEPASGRSRPWRWGVLAAYWLLMLFSTHRPAQPGPPGPNNHLDKVVHVAAFALLAWLLAWCYSGRSPLSLRQAASILVLIVLYGLADELTQPWFSRTFDPLDLIADMAGALIGLAAYLLLSQRRRSNQT